MTKAKERIRPKPAAVADHLFTTLVRSMQRIRSQMRRHGSMEFTIPQYRSLLFIQRNPDCSLSALAENVGMSPSSASALVQRLVVDELVERTPDPNERRRVMLRVSVAGDKLLSRAEDGTRSWLTRQVSRLSADEQQTLHDAMALLARIGEADGEST